MSKEKTILKKQKMTSKSFITTLSMDTTFKIIVFINIYLFQVGCYVMKFLQNILNLCLCMKNVALCGVCQTFLIISYNKVCQLEEQNTPCCECLDNGSHCYCQYATQYNAHFACTRKSTPTHLVWLQRYLWYRRYRTKNKTNKTFNQVLNHHCDLDLEHSNPIFSQDTLAYDGVPVCGGRRIRSAEDRKSYFGYTSHNCDLEDSNPMFSHKSPA